MPVSNLMWEQIQVPLWDQPFLPLLLLLLLGQCSPSGLVQDVVKPQDGTFYILHKRFLLLLSCSAAKISIPGFQELLCQLVKEP